MARRAEEQEREDQRFEQQRKLLEYQHQLELERMRKQQELEEQRRTQQKAAEGQARKRTEQEQRDAISTGTGFFVNPDGYLVTNHHVIAEKANFAIKDLKGRFYKAQLVAKDQRRDLAVLKVSGRFPALKIIHSDNVAKGQHVVAVGYPQPSIQGSESKVTDGVISSFSGIKNDDDWFQISVPIQGGNSGGPLVNDSGQVVGVVVASVNVSKFYSIAGSLPQNINYAIKSKLLLGFLDDNKIRNVSMFSGKATISDVDGASVLVIAKNGPIDVSYVVSPQQNALDERERARQAAEESKRLRESEATEKRRVAQQLAEDARRRKEDEAAERIRQREINAAEKRRFETDKADEKRRQTEERKIGKRDSEIRMARPDWERVRDSELFAAWLKGKPPDVEAKMSSARAADVVEVLRLYDNEKDAFERRNLDEQAASNLSAGFTEYKNKNWGRAFDLLKGPADKGNAEAQQRVGAMYQYGQGVAKSDAEAVNWYRRSAEQGLAISQANLGFMYANGMGLEKDDSEATKWFKKAAQQGQVRIPTIVTGCTDDRDRWVSGDAWCSNCTAVGHDDAMQGCP